MAKIRLALVASVIIMLVATSLFPASAEAAKKLYVGGTFALTGAFAEDMTAALAGFEDYVRYVNETKKLAPWRDEKFPTDITLELLWRDDELKVDKALSIYEELKAKGLMVQRVSGSPQALALRDLLNEDHIGTVGPVTGAYLMSPPQTIFTNRALYTDEMAAIADWFLEGWKKSRKPRVAYLTSDHALGRSIIIPEMKAYLEKIGYEFVGSQFVPLVPTSPPTTQLMWLKKKKVDLALGAMVNPGTQPTVKEMVRLDMGPHLGYKITFGVAYPNNFAMFVRDMGRLGDGVVIANDFPTWDYEKVTGIKWGAELQKKYHPSKWVSATMYLQGIIEGMIQVEALRLALQKVPFDQLKPIDVLEYGFYRIKDLDTGGLTDTPLTYGPGDIEGIDKASVAQVQEGKYVKLGLWPLRHLYKH